MNEDIKLKPTFIRPFRHFIMTIGELPTAYVDTMTYYEMLLWFVNYLRKTVIPAIDKNALALKEVQDLYIELKKYVDDYFDNLDIQDEIDNKLNEMAQDGTLEEIMSTYLNLKAIFCFDTVADMKQATNLVNGSYARTLGFHSINDGGGALYKVKTGLTPNEMNIIEVQNNCQAELNCDVANVLQFGCYGDNSHNDTVPFQACANYAEANSLKFYAPNKTYLLSTVTLNNIKHIQVEGIVNLSNATDFFNVFESTTMYGCNIYINTVNIGTILMKGLNTANVTIQRAAVLTLLADNTPNHGWIAYSKFYLGFTNTINIEDDGSGTKYINENLFIGGRFANLNIGLGNSGYKHENNLFLKPLCEDTIITMNYARNNIIKNARLEGTRCAINFLEESLANIISKDYGYPEYQYWANKSMIGITLNDYTNGANKFMRNEDLNSYNITNINITNNPKNVLTDGDMLYPIAGATIYESDYFLTPNVLSQLVFHSKQGYYKIYLKCYDENKNEITTNPNLLDGKQWVGVTWGDTTKAYANTTYTVETNYFLIKPNQNVKYLKFIIKSLEVSTRYKFDNIQVNLNTYGNINPLVIDMAKKYII